MRFQLAIALLATLPTVAMADITINNNTQLYGTGKMGISPCSKIAGNKGIIQPGQQGFKVPQAILDFYCIGSCTAKVYMDKECDKEVASVKISNKDGVVKVDNHFPEQFDVVGLGKNITINQKSGFEQFINRIFNW